MKNSVLMILCLLVTACSQVSVNRDYDTNYDFSRIGLYTLSKQNVHSENARKVDNDLLDRRLETAVRTNLAMKGLSEVATGGHVTVRYGHYIQTVIESDPVQTNIGYGWGRYGNYGGLGVHSGGTLNQYERSVLVIDVTDTSTGNLVWRGKGSRRVINYNDEPQKVNAAVNEAVFEVLKNFPPQPIL